MSLIYLHEESAREPYLRASFSLGHRLKRLAWRVVWFVLCRPSPVIMHGWRCLILRRFGAKIGANNLIYPGAIIWAPWLLETGNVVTIANGVEIYNPGQVTLGDRAILSQGSFLCSATHDYNNPDFPMVWRPIAIGENAWVCARAVVLPGVTLGQGAVLGAAAVATQSLEAWGVYAGNPARKISERKRTIRE
jgi:putative colanic acid biosynthesis acetyltransferase WcaF